MALRDYLFESALPSYAKQFISFKALAERHPGPGPAGAATSG